MNANEPTNEATLDENCLHELQCVINCFMSGESLHEETLSKEVNQSLLYIFSAFKEEKLKVADLRFEDAEV